MSFKHFWPMYRGTKNTPKQEIYKCTGCGGETAPSKGHNGAPSRHNCKPGCPCRNVKDAPVGNKAAFNATYDRVFPNAPGAGL